MFRTVIQLHFSEVLTSVCDLAYWDYWLRLVLFHKFVLITFLLREE